MADGPNWVGKMTENEFADKYWSAGVKYVYVPIGVNGGRDEAEQIIFNNLHALWNRINYAIDQRYTGIRYLMDAIEACKRTMARQDAEIAELKKALKEGSQNGNTREK